MQPHPYRLTVVGMLAAVACSGVAQQRATPASATASCGASYSADVRRVIDSTMGHAEEALRTGHGMAALEALFAEDAIVLQNNERTWRGRAEAFREQAKSLGDLTFKDHREMTDDVIACGSLAVQSGTYAHTLQRPSGQELKIGGKFILVWRREPDGSWKIVRHMGNNHPPAAR
jgi:ketosteroid isomerase-like protein